MCSVTKEAYAIVLVTDTLKKKKKRQDTLINKNNRIKEVKVCESLLQSQVKSCCQPMML